MLMSKKVEALSRCDLCTFMLALGADARRRNFLVMDGALNISIIMSGRPGSLKVNISVS